MESQFKDSRISKVAEVELIYKTKVEVSEMVKITSSKDAYETFLQAGMKT